MEEYKTIGTHVRPSLWQRFIKVMHRVGFSGYSYLQNCIEAAVRFGDAKHNLSPEMESLMGAFEHCKGWNKQFNLADPGTDPEITEATYYLRDKEKRGVRVVHVERPFFGQWTQNFNVKTILEKFLNLTFPSLYMRLRALAVARECNSILEMLIDLVNELEKEEDKAEFRRPFEDADRSEWGRKPHTQPYMIHHRRSVDEMDSPDLFGTDNDTFLENEHEQ